MTDEKFQTLATYIAKRKSIPHRMRRSIIKRIAPKFLSDYKFKTQMEGGVVFTGSMSNHIDLMIYFCGVHEKYMLHFIKDTLQFISPEPASEVIFMDIGANVGNHTLYLSPLVKQVYAFEPFKRVREQFEGNIHSNNIQNVKVFPYGLSDKKEVLPFYSGPESNLGTSSFTQSHSTENKLIGKVEVFVGDDVVKKEGITKTHIMKIDVEGFEAQVLRGLKKTLDRDHPLVIIELSLTTREQVKTEEAFKALFPEGYKFFYFESGDNDSGRYKLKPFSYALMPKLQDVIAVPKTLQVSNIFPV